MNLPTGQTGPRRALFLSGGGAKGAFEAGVVLGLLERGYRFEFVAGISVGALNAALVAQHDPGGLERAWRSIRGPGDIYRYWPGRGVLDWLGLVNGLYSTAPLRRLVEAHLDPAKIAGSSVALHLGATNLRTGEIEYGGNRRPDRPGSLADWILASAAFPPVFPPVKIGTDWYADGGLRSLVPLMDFLEPQEPASWDEAHVVLCARRGLAPMVNRPRGVLGLGGRALAILSDEVLQGDLRHCRQEARPILLYEPPPGLDMPGSLDFDPRTLRHQLDAGWHAKARPLD